MANKHLKLAPHNVVDDFWWYEEGKGICVCVQITTPNGNKQTSVRNITWRSLRAALKRKDKSA